MLYLDGIHGIVMPNEDRPYLRTTVASSRLAQTNIPLSALSRRNALKKRMSAQEVKEKAKETAKSVAELLDSVKRAANARLAKEAPKVANALDSSFDRAAKGMKDTLKTIDKRTSKEQAELLSAYRSFLQKQTEIIDKKIASMQVSDSQNQRS